MCTLTGMRNLITPKAYKKLSENEQFFYDPVYAKYKTKKVRSYENCDLGYSHFMGWVEERTPIGDPIQWARDNSMTRQMSKIALPKVIDSVLDSNVLMSKILNKEKW